MENFITLFYSITTVFILFIIVTVLSSKKTRTTIYFSLALISLLGWVLTLYFLYIPSITFLTLLGRLNFVFGIMLLPMVSLFVLNFSRNKRSKLEVPVVLETSFLSILALVSPLIVEKEELANGNLITTYGAGYYMFIAHFIFFAIFLAYSLFIANKKVKPSDRLPLKILSISTVFSILVGLITNIVIPVIFTNTDLISVDMYTLSQITSIISAYTFGVPITYAILRYKFLDISILLGQIVHIGVLTVFSYIFMIASYYAVELIELKHTWLWYLITVVTSFIFTSTFIRLSLYTKKVLKENIISPDYNGEEVFTEFKKHLDSTVDTKKLVEILNGDIVSKVNISHLTFYIKENSSNWERHAWGDKNPSHSEIHKLASEYFDFLSKSNNLSQDLFIDSLKLEIPNHLKVNEEYINRVINKADELGISAILSIVNRNELLGIILLGKYNNSSNFNSNDIRFWEDISETLGWALKRIWLYKEIQLFNETLKQKVNEQTKELQIKVKELEEARRKENDMIDIMGHELRTPATIVKLNADLLHNLISKIDEDKESFDKYVSRIKDAVDNEINLINTLLSSAKLEGDKIEINPEAVNIYSEIEMAIHGEEKNAKDKGLKIINEAEKDVSHVFADKARTVEILNNLLSNAVKYTEKGSVSVSTEDSSDVVKISITDTGRGISQDDIKNLGKKFFRTKTYTNSEYSDNFDIVRPGGTGLGLYVTFNLVRKMGGEVTVQSEVGKGSTFSFTLPKYTNQDCKEGLAQSNNMFERLGLKK